MQKIASPLHLSKQFILLYGSVLLASLAIVGYEPFNGWVKGFAVSGILIYGLMVFCYHSQWRGIRQDEQGWWLRQMNKDIPIEIKEDSTVTAYVTVLRFISPPEKRIQSCVIFYDALKGDAYRQLVIQLRNQVKIR